MTILFIARGELQWDFHASTIFASYLFGLSFVRLLRPVTFRIREPAQILQYHACEHKTIAVLGRSLPPSISSLHEMNKTTIYCGFSTNMHWVQVLFIGGLLFTFGSQSILWVIFGLQLGGYFCNDALSYFLNRAVHFTGRKYILWMLYVPFIPLWIVPLSVERIFGLKEPTDEMLQEGMEAAMEVYRLQGKHHLIPEAQS